MKNILLLAFLAFFVTVDIPLSKSKLYKDVQSFFARDGYYCLVLKDNKTVYVPIMWTIIEEK